eukprot:2896867-Lingulodinium_polyedra.AAC.1
MEEQGQGPRKESRTRNMSGKGEFKVPKGDVPPPPKPHPAGHPPKRRQTVSDAGSQGMRRLSARAQNTMMPTHARGMAPTIW